MWIPYAVVGVGVLSTFLMLGVLGREGLGPWSKFGGSPSQQNPQYPLIEKRSLDAEEEA